MTETEARDIAEAFLLQNGRGNCPIKSLRRVHNSSFRYSDTRGYEWIALADVKIDEEDATQASVMVVIDETTRLPAFFDTL